MYVAGREICLDLAVQVHFCHSHVPMVFLCKFGQNPSIGSGDRVQTRLIFTVFIVWWPWKLGHGHQNLINSILIIPMIQYIKFGQNPSFGSRDRVQTSFFGQYLTFKVLVRPWKWGEGHQNLIISFPCLSGVSVQVWSKSTNWFRRERADKANFYSLYSVVTLKIRSRSPNLINSFNYPNDTIHKVWPESIICFKG